jgi:hypothetical protein
MPAVSAPEWKLGAELPRRGLWPAGRHQSPSPPWARAVSWAVLAAPGWELAARPRTRPGPARTQTEAGPTRMSAKPASRSPSSAEASPRRMEAKPASRSPRSAEASRRSPRAAAPRTDPAPPPAEASCWHPRPNRAAALAVPKPWIEGDRQHAGLRRVTPADPLDAGLRRVTPASPLDAGSLRAALAGRLAAGAV